MKIKTFTEKTVLRNNSQHGRYVLLLHAGNTMASLLYLLARNPDKQELLRQ
jgi:hypothetical protein